MKILNPHKSFGQCGPANANRGSGIPAPRSQNCAGQTNMSAIANVVSSRWKGTHLTEREKSAFFRVTEYVWNVLSNLVR